MSGSFALFDRRDGHRRPVLPYRDRNRFLKCNNSPPVLPLPLPCPVLSLLFFTMRGCLKHHSPSPSPPPSPSPSHSSSLPTPTPLLGSSPLPLPPPDPPSPSS